MLGKRQRAIEATISDDIWMNASQNCNLESEGKSGEKSSKVYCQVLKPEPMYCSV